MKRFGFGYSRVSDATSPKEKATLALATQAKVAKKSLDTRLYTIYTRLRSPLQADLLVAIEHLNQQHMAAKSISLQWSACKGCGRLVGLMTALSGTTMAKLHSLGREPWRELPSIIERGDDPEAARNDQGCAFGMLERVKGSDAA